MQGAVPKGGGVYVQGGPEDPMCLFCVSIPLDVGAVLLFVF
jgi:hypothetical protein